MPGPDPLRWRLRRGMKELDVVLERYYRDRYPAAGAARQRAFARLLEHEDPLLWSWLSAQSAAPAEFQELIDELRRHP